jgi:hypothetical protein
LIKPIVNTKLVESMKTGKHATKILIHQFFKADRTTKQMRIIRLKMKAYSFGIIIHLKLDYLRILNLVRLQQPYLQVDVDLIIVIFKVIFNF